MLSDGAFAVCGYYSTVLCGMQEGCAGKALPEQLLRDTRPVNKDCLYLGQHLKGAACGDDEVGVLAHLQRADAVGYADMLRRVEGDGLQRVERAGRSRGY